MHSDHGSQFSSYDWQDFLKAHNLVGSMNRRGNCHDNAVAESFFLNFVLDGFLQGKVIEQELKKPIKSCETIRNRHQSHLLKAKSVQSFTVYPYSAFD